MALAFPFALTLTMAAFVSVTVTSLNRTFVVSIAFIISSQPVKKVQIIIITDNFFKEKSYREIVLGNVIKLLLYFGNL